MLTYKIHPILCDDIHYIDSQPFKVAKVIKFDFCDQIIHLDYPNHMPFEDLLNPHLEYPHNL